MQCEGLQICFSKDPKSLLLSSVPLLVLPVFSPHPSLIAPALSCRMLTLPLLLSLHLSFFLLLFSSPYCPYSPIFFFFKYETKVWRSIAMAAMLQQALPSVCMRTLNFSYNGLKRTGRGQLEAEKKSEGECKSNEKWDKTIGNAFRLTSPPFPTVVIHLGGSSVHSLS